MSETVENKGKEGKGGYICKILGSLGSILLINWSTDKGQKSNSSKATKKWKWQRVIKRYYENKYNYKGVNSKNNLPKIKDGACVCNKSWSIEINRSSSNDFVWEWKQYEIFL